MVLVPGLRIRLAVAAGGNIQRRLDPMTKLTKLEKYHRDYVPTRRVEKMVAVTPAAKEIEQRAIARELAGQFRIASHLWLKCFDAAETEVERAKIALRRDRCIGNGNRLRQGEYSGVGCRGVVYE